MRRALLALLVAAVLAGAGAASASAIGIDYACSPGPCNVWHTTPVTVQWTAIDGTLGCAPGAPVTARQVVTADGKSSLTCTASDGANGLASKTIEVWVDRTPPVVSPGATTSRLPDHGEWYRVPVQVSFAGSDATSGIRSCSSIVYAGPDADPATVLGTCTDIAGNVSRPSPFALRFDATPPAAAPPRTHAGDHMVRVEWSPPPDAAAVAIVRTPGRGHAASSVIHRGAGHRLVDRRVHNGRRYTYALQATDAAGNTATVAASAVPARRLLGPADGAVLSRPPRLAWTRAPHARYYNVQLFRGRHKVLSSWPRRAHLALRRSWRYAGHRRHLRPGRYRWYVWPGHGRPSARRYGAPIGHAHFRLAPRART